MPLLSNVAGTIRRIYGRMTDEPVDPQVREVVETLRQMPVFQMLNRRQLRQLAAAMHRRNYTRDEIVYYENDPGLGFYVVQRGRVRLLVEGPSGAPEEVRQVGEHELFGDLSIYGDMRRMETAQALVETRLLGFFRPDLRGLVKRHPRTGNAVLTALAHYLAVRHVDVLRLLAEREGRRQAAEALYGAEKD